MKSTSCSMLNPTRPDPAELPEWLPMFPLELVAYPGQPVNLRIFEPRYRQLVADLGLGGYFCIPPYINGSVFEFGTLMQIVEITEMQADGKCNLRTTGIQTLQINDFRPSQPGKQYAAGRVSFMPDEGLASPVLQETLLEQRRQLFELMGMIAPEIDLPEGKRLSFAVAGKMGLRLEQEAHILTLAVENHRLSYLIAQLQHINEVLEATEKTKMLVKSNGHFKNFNELGF